MVSASVGFQCPECVQEGTKSQREARTTFGGTIRARDGLVTSILIGICVVAWLLELALPQFEIRFEMFPLAVSQGQWYRLITSGFLHGSWLHILFNMWALWVVGRPLEAMLGRARYIGLYGASLLAGSTAAYLLDPIGQASVGASGAIFGLFGALLIVYRRLNLNLGPILALVGINAVFTFVVPNIDWHAHVGGFIGGLIVTAAAVYPPRKYWPVSASIGVAAVVLLCGLAIVVRTHTIQQDIVVINQGNQGNQGGSSQPPDTGRPFP
jgi:membrane associated rhomboid family serine protease